MKLLKMNGCPITNIYDYNNHFNLYDVLRQRNEFLSFALSHFANLSKTNLYCVGMAYAAIEGRNPPFMDAEFENSNTMFDVERCSFVDFWSNPFNFCQTCCPSKELLSISQRITHQFENEINHPKINTGKIVTIAAFVLLDNSPHDLTIDMDRVINALSGISDSQKQNPLELFFADDLSNDIQTIYLDPSSDSYNCSLFNGDIVDRIKTFRIVASKKITSLSHRTVKIRIKDEIIYIPSGEHIYVNSVKGDLACVLPKHQTKNEITLKNNGIERDVLSYDECDVKQAFYINEYITSFDFSGKGKNIIYLNNLKLSLDMCASQLLYEQLNKFCEQDFVEVKLDGSTFFLLEPNGDLISNDPKFNGKHQIYSIEDMLRRFK